MSLPQKRKSSPVPPAENKKKPKSSAATSISQLLSADFTARDLLVTMKDGTTIVVNSDETFWTGLRTLMESKILSAPVLDKPSNKWIGFVDTLDLVAATVELLEGSEFFRTADDDDAIEDIEGLLTFGNVPLQSVADFSRADSFLCVHESASSMAVAEALAKPHQHRVAVVDSNGVGLGVVSQSGIIEHIVSEYPEEVSALGLTVRDLKLTASLATLPHSATALEALKQLKQQQLTALPVVDDGGKLVDVFSASDLMLWSEWMLGGQVMRFSNLSALRENIKDYLTDSRTQREMPPRTPIVCSPDEPIDRVIDTLLVNNVHRVFVTENGNQNGKPLSVVTYGDILRCILDRCGRLPAAASAAQLSDTEKSSAKNADSAAAASTQAV